MGLQRVGYDWAAFPLTLTLKRLHTVWFHWHEILEKIKLLRYRIDDWLLGVKDSGRQCYWRNSTGSFQGNGIFWYPDHIGILSEAICVKRDFPGGDSGKESTCQCRRQRRPGFHPWVGKIPTEKEMATQSSVLAWRIPWTEEPGGLQSIGSQRLRHNWSNFSR